MGKKKGIEAASEQLTAELARIEQMTQRLVEGVEAEANDRDDQNKIRERLGALRQQVGQFAENAGPLLERARSATERAEQTREIIEDVTSVLDTLSTDSRSGADTIDPDNWQWDEHEEEQREIRNQLAALHRQAQHLAQSSAELLGRATEATKRAELKRDLTDDFASKLETLIDGITSASDAVDPDNWEWDA